MKSTVKICCLLGLSLIFTFGIISFINITHALTIDISAGNEHIVRLHSLFLWNYDGNNEKVSMEVKNGNNLELDGGLMVGNRHTLGNYTSSVIGGGEGNTVNAGNAGILGGNGNTNTNNGNNSLIGGGNSNTITSEGSMIGGGSGNTVSAQNGVIVGGSENTNNGKNSVILGGYKNTANGKNSLVLGSDSEGSGSFVWRAKAKEDSARIDVNSGVLIGTNKPINGVRLVVSGAMSLPNYNSTGLGITGEIKVANGCIYGYDGRNWQVMGKSESTCGKVGTCKFGKVLLADGDRVTAYSVPFGDCSSSSHEITCTSGGTFDLTGYIYPYCYEID